MTWSGVQQTEIDETAQRSQQIKTQNTKLWSMIDANQDFAFLLLPKIFVNIFVKEMMKCLFYTDPLFVISLQ